MDKLHWNKIFDITNYIIAKCNIDIIIYHLEHQFPEKVFQPEDVEENESEHDTVHSTHKNPIQEIPISEEALNIFDYQVIFDIVYHSPAEMKVERIFQNTQKIFVQIATNELNNEIIEYFQTSFQKSYMPYTSSKINIIQKFRKYLRKFSNNWLPNLWNVITLEDVVDKDQQTRTIQLMQLKQIIEELPKQFQ